MNSKDLDTLLEFLRFPLNDTQKVFRKFSGISGAISRGRGLNKFLFIEGTRENRVLLVAHADTFWDKHYNNLGNRKQEIIQQKDEIRNRNGLLGADDRAGCAIIYLLKDLGHSILITNGEEHGQKGSNWLMSNNIDLAEKINHKHQFVVQLDRKNGTDFKCYSVGTDEFRKYVAETTGYTEPERQSRTDIVRICRDICGVNLSIGYYHAHSPDEFLILPEWENTLNICRKWLSQKNLPRFELKRES